MRHKSEIQCNIFKLEHCYCTTGCKGLHVYYRPNGRAAAVTVASGHSNDYCGMAADHERCSHK